MLKNLSLKWKILIVTLLGFLIISLISAYLHISDIQEQAISTIIEKSKAVVLSAEAAREEMSNKIDRGILKDFDVIKRTGTREDLINAVPVITAINVAKKNSEEAGYKFRVPKFAPRNPENEPIGIEKDVLSELTSNKNLKEKVVIEENQIRYFRPIYLTEECLYCHGSPRGELDPIGGEKEGWKTGEMHGAFEIISSLDKTKQTIAEATITIIIVNSIILFVIGLLIWLIIRAVTKPLHNYVENFNKASDGDLTVRVKTDSKDEVGQLSQYFNDFFSNLNSNVLRINKVAKNLTSGSDQLNEISNEISEGSQSQAASIEQTSASMEELTASIKMVADNSNEVRDKSNDLFEIAEHNKEIIQNVINSMNKINENSENITQIIDLIAEIAEQTNLLSLNASIEAQRAGEAGRGFSVVADSISKLADRSAENSKQIGKLIDANLKNVDEGVKLVNDAGKAFNNIADTISATNDLINQITKSMDEQSLGANEIQLAIEQINQITQNNTIITEKMTENTADLNGMAETLNELVSKFKVKEE